MSHTARVATVRHFGAPDVISIEELSFPSPGAGEVLVAVRTGGLNPVDTRRRAGTFGGSVPMVLGTEFAGVVLESADPAFSRGDEVVGWGVAGADADLVLTDASRLINKPEGIDWALAGGLSGVGQTAMTALKALSLKQGDLVVIHGAAGAVGTVLVQLAIASGLKVIGTASESNQDYLRGLGATPVVYGDGLAQRLQEAADGQPVAASIDLAGSNEAGEFALAVLAAGGEAVTLVPETMAFGLRLVQVRHSKAQLQELFDLVLSGALRLPVSTLPFTQIREAHERLEARHSQGKLVLDLSDNPHLVAATA